MDASAGAGVVQANGAAGLMCSFLCSPGVRTVRLLVVVPCASGSSQKVPATFL